jgi:hypothetical protein
MHFALRGVRRGKNGFPLSSIAFGGRWAAGMEGAHRSRTSFLSTWVAVRDERQNEQEAARGGSAHSKRKAGRSRWILTSSSTL